METLEKNIVVCDDNVDITDMLEAVLEDVDATIHVVNDSTEAITKLGNICPEVLIVDLSMPIVTGDEIIRAIRGDPSLAAIYIVCISASIDGHTVAMGAGADIFLEKPLDIYELIDLVSIQCARKRLTP